ncbi:MAG: response regulator transcription factor [Bacteroides sp.]|jgi:two-component system response regulator NreC|nr:response regulator transcription factor [Bacteroides sp.]
MGKIKVALVDDHKLVTDCIGLFLESAENLSVTGVGHSGKEAIALLEKEVPDVILLDISMPEMSGIETTEIIKKKYPNIKVLILSMHADYDNISDAIDAGADGYVPKDVASEELVEAITALNAGKNYFHTKISDEIVRNYSNKKKKTSSPFPELTRRELEVLQLFAEGYNNSEIADKLFLSVRTIESHKNHILQKTNMKNSVELIKFAIKNKIIEI